MKEFGEIVFEKNSRVSEKHSFKNSVTFDEQNLLSGIGILRNRFMATIYKLWGCKKYKI